MYLGTSVRFEMPSQISRHKLQEAEISHSQIEAGKVGIEKLASSEDFLFLMSYVGGGKTWQKKEEGTRESQNPLLQ